MGHDELSPQIIIAIAACHFHARAEYVRQLASLEDFFFGSVRDDLPAAHQQHARDLWYVVGEVVILIDYCFE